MVHLEHAVPALAAVVGAAGLGAGGEALGAQRVVGEGASWYGADVTPGHGLHGARGQTGAAEEVEDCVEVEKDGGGGGEEEWEGDGVEEDWE